MIIFNKRNLKRPNKKGFTLLEVLMAIFILTVAVGASYILIQKTFLASALTQSKLIAYYIAQEGIENIRNIRDTNWLNGAAWNEGIPGQQTENIYFMDGSESKFERTTYVSVNEDLMQVSVKVNWEEKGNNYSVEALNNLYNWYEEPETPEE